MARALFVLAVAAICGTAMRADDPRPNFIFILADDWGWGDVFADNDLQYQSLAPNHTPNLNNLAKQGTLFVDYHTANPVCSPSRTGIMTGRGPSQFRIDTALNQDWRQNENKNQANFLPPSTPTVTSLLQDNGYRTGHFGKWHLGSGNGTLPNGTAASAPVPTEYGIDESCTFNSNDPCQADGKTANSSTMIVDSAIDFINRTRAMQNPPPFYVNLWLHVSHNLLNPSEEQKQLCIKQSQRCDCKDMADNQTTCAHQVFWSAQQDADAQLGRLFDVLGELNLHESTIVVFTTDNGPEEQMVYQAAVGNTGPFRGRKRSLYEGGHRVPFIVSWGGGTPKPSVGSNTVDNTLLGGVDWLPTVAGLLNISLPDDLAGLLDGQDMSEAIFRLNDGASTNGALTDSTPRVIRPPFPRTTRPYLFWEWRFPVAGPCESVAPQLAVRGGRYKLLRDIADWKDGGRVELYDLSLFNESFTNERGEQLVSGDRIMDGPKPVPDYHEMQNLATIPGAPYQDVVDRLNSVLMEWFAKQPKQTFDTVNWCSVFPYPGRSNTTNVLASGMSYVPEDSEPDV